MQPLLALLLAAIGSPAGVAQQGLRLEGSAAESFLLESKVERVEDIDVGVTHPRRVTLSDGTSRCFAVWKTVDIEHRGITRFSTGGAEANFRDSYKNEIAAYELDKLLGLGLVPPTVERRIRRSTGSLQMWIEDAVTEWDRLHEELPVKSPKRFVERLFTVRLFHQLTYNVDHKNARNILIGEDGYVWAIDHSRAFRQHEALIAEIEIQRFSRSALESLRALTLESLDERLRTWLTKAQREAILARRDLLLQRAEMLIAERGEAAVLFP